MTHLRVNRCTPGYPQYQATNNLVNWLWNDFANDYAEVARPSANIVETKENYRIELAVPGFEKSEIKIKLEEQILTLSGEPVESKADENEKVIRHEFTRKPFRRSFRLSNWVDSSAITASFSNGILLVTIPKVEMAKSKPAQDINID